MAEKSIEQLMAELQGMSYSRPSSYSGYKSVNTSVNRQLPDWKPTNLTQDNFGSLAKKPKDKDGINLWDVLSGTLGQPSGIMTNFAHGQIGAFKNLGSKKNDTSLGKEIYDVLIGKSLGMSFGKGLVAGGKKQIDNWMDGELKWGDVPGVGVLNGMDKHWKRGINIAQDHMGLTGKKAIAAGIGIDIGADPLTYLTGGLSAATKARKVAEVAEIAKQAKNLNVTGKFKNAATFQEAARAKLVERYADKVAQSRAAVEASTRKQYAKYPNLVDKMVEKNLKEAGKVYERLIQKQLDNVTNSIKTAANGAYNTNINKWGFGVPFSNKANVMVGNYGKNNLLHRSEATVGTGLVNDLITKLTGGDPAKAMQIENLIKARYGVSSLDELTKTHFDDLSSKLKGFENPGKGLPDVEVVSKIVKKAMPPEDFDRLMNSFRSQNITWAKVKNQLNDILLLTGDNPALRKTMGAHLAQAVSDYWATATTGMRGISKADRAARAESMKWASQFLQQSDTFKTVENTVTDIFPKGNPAKTKNINDKNFYKNAADLKNKPFNEMMNGRTKFEHWLDKKNIFDTRTLATGDKLVNSMGDHISDAHSQRIGETAQYGKALEDLQKFIKKNNIKKEQMEQAIYVIEKHAPDHLGGSKWKPSPLVQKLADQLRPTIDEIGKNESAGGVLKNLRANYFPHVVNKSSDIIDEVDDFIKRNKEFNGLKGTSKFDQARKGFQTLAQRDNYIKKIEKAIQKETNADRIKTLQKQQEHVADLFDTDVVSALTRRVKEGTRAKAMKAMQGELSKFGMMKTIAKGSKDSPPTGLTKLDSAVAKKMGLGEGTHYMHPEVLKAVQRVDEIFTDENMNKAARMVSAIGDIWRPLVTYYKPAHYLNNMIGNTMMNIAAGVRPKDVKSAVKLLKAYRSGKATDEEIKIIKSAYSHNVISGGFLFDSKATFEFDNPNAIEKFAKMIGENKGISKVRKQGEIIDDWSRLANYINGLDKYGNPKKAAEQVRKYLFNYNELTNADRNMRVIVPFWNWTKRNIPLQMKLLMENPQFALNVERFKNFFNDGEKGEDWQKETGIKVSDKYYTGLPSPTHDLNTVLNPKSLLSSMTPAIKMPLEMNFNKKLYTGNPISYGSKNVQSEDMFEYIMSNLGVGNNAYQAATGDKSTFENIMGMLRPVSKIRE